MEWTLLSASTNTTTASPAGPAGQWQHMRLMSVPYPRDHKLEEDPHTIPARRTSSSKINFCNSSPSFPTSFSSDWIILRLRITLFPNKCEKGNSPFEEIATDGIPEWCKYWGWLQINRNKRKLFIRFFDYLMPRANCVFDHASSCISEQRMLRPFNWINAEMWERVSASEKRKDKDPASLRLLMLSIVAGCPSLLTCNWPDAQIQCNTLSEMHWIRIQRLSFNSPTAILMDLYICTMLQAIGVLISS